MKPPVEDLAERIAAGLRARKLIGDELRQQERDRNRMNVAAAQKRYRAERAHHLAAVAHVDPTLREKAAERMKPIDAAFEAITAANAAEEMETHDE
jgi:predicted metalloprotease